MTNDARDILVVDDNHTNIVVLQAMLKLLGYVSRTAANGTEAISLADSPVPALILMDLSMPGVSGVDAAIAIREQHPGVHIPIIAVTAHNTRQYREACANAGFDGFLTKPIDVNCLRTYVQTHLTGN